MLCSIHSEIEGRKESHPILAPIVVFNFKEYKDSIDRKINMQSNSTDLITSKTND